MEKRKEGRPGETRAILRRSIRENGYVASLPFYNVVIIIRDQEITLMRFLMFSLIQAILYGATNTINGNW